MSELIEKLSRCINNEQLRMEVIHIDDFHNPELNDTSSWIFTHRGQKFEFIRHGGYLITYKG